MQGDTAPDTNNSKTDFHKTCEARQRHTDGDIDKPGGTIAVERVFELGSPVVLGVTVDGFCKNVHCLAVLALPEHLNALH